MNKLNFLIVGAVILFQGYGIATKIDPAYLYIVAGSALFLIAILKFPKIEKFIFKKGDASVELESNDDAK